MESTTPIPRKRHPAPRAAGSPWPTTTIGHRSLATCLKEAIEAVDAAAGRARPAFYGINCSHPLEFQPALEPGAWFERVRALRPNAAMMDKLALCALGHLERGDPPALASMMRELARRHQHIDIWGGCCGTWDTHLDEIAQHVLASRETSV